MKIELLKKYAFAVTPKPKGTIAEVTSELGNKLIKKKIAKEVGADTRTADDDLADKVREAYNGIDES